MSSASEERARQRHRLVFAGGVYAGQTACGCWSKVFVDKTIFVKGLLCIEQGVIFQEMYAN